MSPIPRESWRNHGSDHALNAIAARLRILERSEGDIACKGDPLSSLILDTAQRAHEALADACWPQHRSLDAAVRHASALGRIDAMLTKKLRRLAIAVNAVRHTTPSTLQRLLEDLTRQIGSLPSATKATPKWSAKRAKVELSTSLQSDGSENSKAMADTAAVVAADGAAAEATWHCLSEAPEFEIASEYEDDISVLHQCDWHDVSTAAVAPRSVAFAEQDLEIEAEMTHLPQQGNVELGNARVRGRRRLGEQGGGTARGADNGKPSEQRRGSSLELLASALGEAIFAAGGESPSVDNRHGQSFSTIADDTSEDTVPELSAQALGDALLRAGGTPSSKSNDPPDKPMDIHIRGCRKCAVSGTYAYAGEDPSGTCFFQSCGESGDFLYARDGRWLFGPERDSDDCWAFADSSDALPPRHGWAVPACQHDSKMWLDAAKQATRSSRFVSSEPVAR